MKKLMNIKIVKNIPIPLELRNNMIYPWVLMKVGDSFLSEIKKPDNHDKRLKSICTSYRKFIRENQPKWEFTCRKEGSAIRIWRIK